MSIQRITKTLAALLVSAIAVGGAPARAYEYAKCNGKPGRWEGRFVTFRPISISFPSGSARRAVLDRVADAWRLYAPDSFFFPILSDMNAAGWKSGNGANEVALGVTWDILYNGALAVTVLRTEPCVWPYFDGARGDIREADVVFDERRPWNVSPQPNPLDSAYSMALVGVHEFGHALGLKHENDVMATMNAQYPSSGPLGSVYDPDPHADDVAGARRIYGTLSSTNRDISLSIYRRTGAGTSDRIPPPTALVVGRSANVTVTVGNRGETLEMVPVHAYASTDASITSADVRIGAVWLPPLPAGFEATYSMQVTIPSMLAPGLYYVGFIADPFRSIPETDEGNNAVRYLTRVQVSPPPAS